MLQRLKAQSITKLFRKPLFAVRARLRARHLGDATVERIEPGIEDTFMALMDERPVEKKRGDG
jgi:hypothetical protein